MININRKQIEILLIFGVLIALKEFAHLNEFYTMMLFMLIAELLVVAKTK